MVYYIEIEDLNIPIYNISSKPLINNAYDKKKERGYFVQCLIKIDVISKMFN